MKDILRSHQDEMRNSAYESSVDLEKTMNCLAQWP